MISLKAAKSSSYDLKYYHKLRGFLYSLQRESKYFNKHDASGYKFFCFSNILPPVDMKAGDKRTLIISSPDSDFITWLYGKISEMLAKGMPINIGEMQFQIINIKYLTPKLTQNLKLITGTPIVLRIPKERYKDYSIESVRPYEYWRPEYDFNSFVKQLSENLIKKYNEYYGKNIESTDLFETFKFKKTVCVHKIEAGTEQKIVGSVWEFEFKSLEGLKKDILTLGIESGFGELNSSGFGFMNIALE